MTNKKDDMKSKNKKEVKGKLKKKTPTSGSPKELVKALKKDDKSFQRMKVVPKAVSGPRMLSTKLIHPNPYNCNKMDPAELDALEADMKYMKHPSMMDPLRVRVDGKKFEIIDGEHRFTVAKKLKWPEIHCTVFSMPQDDAMLWNFRINRQRGTHDPTKEAAFFKHLKDDLGLTQQRIGELLNVDRSVVSRRISILNIDEDILKAVDLKKTPVSVLEVIAQAPTKELQEELFSDYSEYGTSVETMQDSVVEKKVELAKHERFKKMLSESKFPKCPKCDKEATDFYWTEPYVTDSMYGGHVWNPETGLSKRKEDAQEQASSTGHPTQSRIISVFRHKLSPSEIVAKARENFADFAQVVFNQVSEVRLNYEPGNNDDYTAKLTTGGWGNPEIHIDSDQGSLQIVLEAKAYGSGDQTKVIVSEPSTYEKGGLEKAEKLLSKLIEGKLTFKKMAKTTTKKAKKLKLPAPKKGTIQPSNKEMWQLEAKEVYKALARFCNHGKSTNFSQDELLCGGYRCTECLVQETLEEMELWGTDAMGDGSINSKAGEFEHYHHTDEGLPIPVKLRLMNKFRKLLSKSFGKNATGGSSPLNEGEYTYVISVTRKEKELGESPLREVAHTTKQLSNIKSGIEASQRDLGNALAKGKPKGVAKLMKKNNDAALNKEDKMGIEAAIKKEKDEDARMRLIDGLSKCAVYSDRKYCNRCVNGKKFKDCWKDPRPLEEQATPPHPETMFGQVGLPPKTTKKKKPRPNECGVYETYDETILFETPDKRAKIDIELVDTGKGWAVGMGTQHNLGSCFGHGSPCSLDKNPHKTRADALQYAILSLEADQQTVIKKQVGSEASKAQISNAQKLLKLLGELRDKENLPKKKTAKKKAAKKKTKKEEKRIYGLVSVCSNCDFEFESEKGTKKPKCPKCHRVVS